MPHLTQDQRYQIEADLRAGFCNTLIAQRLACSLRTVQRELAANGGRDNYTAKAAIASRFERSKRSNQNHPQIDDSLWESVRARLMLRHSPEQIIGQLKLALSVSTVYRYIRRQGLTLLAKRLRFYRARKTSGKRGWHHQAHPIRNRPESVKTRDSIGHMECDSIVGKKKESAKIVVLIDRATRYLRMRLVVQGTADKVAACFKTWRDDPRLPILSLTTDQGSEFACLPDLFAGQIYVCDAGKPYQKGSVENMNGLIRQYIPKGVSLLKFRQADLDRIADEINHRPRKRHGFQSPHQLLSELTATRQFER